jgi:MoxR-like ATPase
VIPHDPSIPGVNPRELVVDQGPQALAELLAGTGYRIQKGMLGDHIKSLMSGKPHCIEGERGCGKTAFAEALAEGCNMPVFYLQGMEGLTLGDVLYSWDTEGQNQWVRQALASQMSLEEARQKQWAREYLVLGEALAAYDFAAREKLVPLLIIDEFDKLPESIMHMLLQLFGRAWAHVPRVGNVGVWDSRLWPVVVLTSNDMGKISAPMRSRCVYTWVDNPSPEEEVAILRSRVPRATPDAVGSVAKLIDSIRGIAGVEERPALREGIDLLNELTRQGVQLLTEDVLADHLCLIAKTCSDRSLLYQSLGRIEWDVTRPHEEIDELVERAFAHTRSEVVLELV